MYNNLRVGCKLEVQLMAKYLTRQRKRLLAYLSEHTDEQMTARQIADALAADNISISAVYRNLSALEEEGLLKRSVREGTREVFYQYIAAERQPAPLLPGMRQKHSSWRKRSGAASSQYI